MAEISIGPHVGVKLRRTPKGKGPAKPAETQNSATAESAKRRKNPRKIGKSEKQVKLKEPLRAPLALSIVSTKVLPYFFL